MYFKLSLRSVKRSFADFAVYFLTLTVGVCLFYVFNSVSAQQALLDVSASQKETMTSLSSFLTIVSVFVSFILGFLCLFGNQFLMKRRKKEFGLYMTLGMSKSKISRILMIETALVAVLSLVMGLVLGGIVSQGMAVFTASLFKVNVVNYQFVFSASAMFKTIGYFTGIFIVVMIFNTIMISKYTILDLLTAKKKNEEISATQSKYSGILFVLSILMMIGGYFTIIKVGLNSSMWILELSVVVVLIATFLFYYSGSSVIFKMIKKNKKLYYKDSRMFVIRQIYSKVNTSFLSMTIISLMLFFTLSILSIGFSYKNALEQDLEIIAPYDATIDIRRIESDNDFEKVEKELSKLGLNINEYDSCEGYIKYSIDMDGSTLLGTNVEGAIAKSIEEGFPIPIEAIKHSDYVKQMELQGLKPVEIKSGETLVLTNMNEAIKTIQNFTSTEQQITIGDIQLRLPKNAYQVVGIESTNVGRIVACFVIPDDTDTSEFYRSMIYNIQYNDNEASNSEEQLRKAFDYFLTDEVMMNGQFSYTGMTKAMAYEIVASETSTLIYVGIYLGIVFLIASGAVLALQQLLEANDSAERYKMLKRIGATKAQIGKAVFQQVFIYFAAPLLLAISHSLFAIFFMQQNVVFAGTTSLAFTAIMSLIMFLVLYGAYFMATYTGYKRIVKE